MSEDSARKNELRQRIKEQIEIERPQLLDLSDLIHSHPELGFQEEKAAAWLTDYLETKGFQIERGISGLPTAFRASTGRGQPVVALLAEYDALPDIGHACGHNIIAAASVGAAVASRFLAQEYSGTIQVLGTPGEEFFGGKLNMIEAGVFSEVEAALEVHPAGYNLVNPQALACISLNIEFFGKEAHAAICPEKGLNALEAMILSFNAVNALRQHLPPNSRIHGIITDGGRAANIVPVYSAAQFLIRAVDLPGLVELQEKTLSCFRAGAEATGCRLRSDFGDKIYAPLHSNLTLARRFGYNLESLGRRLEPLESRFSLGSTDMGNVSQVVPTIHPTIAIAPPEVSAHSYEFAQAALSAAGHEALLDAATALALTVADLMTDPELMTEVKNEFYDR